MNMNNRQLLRKQLEQQAELFTTEQDNAKLTSAVLATCSALLRAVERNMPKTPSQSDFDGMYAGYLGVSSRVRNFYTRNADYMDAKESAQLQEIVENLKKSEDSRKELEEELAEQQNQHAVLTHQLETLQEKLEETQEKCTSLETEKDQTSEQIRNANERISGLEEELNSLNHELETLEPNIELLIGQIDTTRSSQQELRAYYSELERIENGISEEGFVNLEDFLAHLQAMNNTGNELIAKYDQLLKNLSQDVQGLQEKIETRRKANG